MVGALKRELPTLLWRRQFSSSCRRPDIKDFRELPDRIYPSYRETKSHDLLSLQWPSPPRNILLVKKDTSPQATASLVEFAKHICSTYPSISIILEPSTASELHTQLPVAIYTHTHPFQRTLPFDNKTDLITSFGGDGTILRASSLFSTSPSVPPILSFSMGTLGFLGEWKFADYKRAFREAYMSGVSLHERGPALATPTDSLKEGWAAMRGKSLGSQRASRVLLRSRLKVSSSPCIFNGPEESTSKGLLHAMNEIILHRGSSPHLTNISISIGSGSQAQHLTTAIADGIIISTPTGSTAYSLSSGGSIVHPLVPALLITPICPRSLSFRPLVLPANVQVRLRVEETMRGDRGVEVSVDGRREGGLGVGGEVLVQGEEVGRMPPSEGEEEQDVKWKGGVPCILRGGKEEGGGDGWVGGLNGLLKFNYPFGEDG
ncbi:MAG: NADH kinase pos5 [Icmadophila ericetorum]|nr:NADH kinase pos5 [Icmadophila ericetorum]